MNIYTRKQIECQSILPGLGKTFMAIEFIINQYNNTDSLRVVYAAPTIVLLKQVKNSLLNYGISEQDILFINSLDEKKKSIQTQIKAANLPNRKKVIVLISHVSFLNFYHYFDNIDIKIFDEEMESAFEILNPKMTIEEERGLFHKFIDYETNESNPKISKLKLKEGHPEIIRDGLSYKSMNHYFYQFLENDTFDLYAISDSLVDYYDRKRNDIVYFKIAKPKVFKSKIKTYYLGFDVHNSTSSIIMNLVNDIEFIESNEFKDELVRTTYSNNFEINYFFEGRVSNRTLRYSKHDYVKKIKDLVIKDNLMKDSLYVWQFDKDDKFKEFLTLNNAKEVPAKPHGLNDPEWMEYNKVVIAGNYRITPLESIICKALNIVPEKLIQARHINMIIQIMTRCSVRKSDLPNITMIVSDEDTADLISDKLINNDNKIRTKHLGLVLNKENGKNERAEINSSKENIRGKINYLKKKGNLKNKEKIKLLKLEEQYRTLLVRK